MEHLAVDEIIEFVSFTEINEKNMDLVRRVNGHIKSCNECREKVEAYQAVYDKLYRLEKGLDSESIITEDEIYKYVGADDIINCLETEEIERISEAELELKRELNRNS